MRTRILAAAVALSALAVAGPAPAANCAAPPTGMIPLGDLGAGTYQGFEGGLYPGGANTRPAGHEAVGTALARLAVPRDSLGFPDPVGGTSVLLTIGMSNTRNESNALIQRAASDPLRHPRVVIVNGAQGGQDAVDISDPAAPYWGFVDRQLTDRGLTPAHVQAVWLKEAIARPTETFPADAQRLQSELREIVTILKARFPNLFLVSVSSRIYAGYATTTLNPEPYAYQSGFAVKWLIERQIEGLDPVPVLPWLSWGPYPWADGLNPRGDGLTWSCSDFAADGTHPSASGSAKVAGMILDFLHNDSVFSVFYRQAGGP